jgi:glycerol-3-phosphate dehydrogenase
MDRPESKPLVRPSQGVHVVLDRSFMKGDSALMIPKTSDGRVLFVIPWHEHVLVGTTDTPLNQHSLEPVALDQEVDFILSTVKKYLTHAPDKSDVLSVFAGLRPLAAPQKNTGSTKEISRDHKLMVSESGLITITGGKWTTYRKMAEDTVNKAIVIGGLTPAPSLTKSIPIHGFAPPAPDALSIYGSDSVAIRRLMVDNPLLNKPLVESLPYTEAEVIWVTRHEMARTVEDVLARRLRILFLDAKAALQAAPRVAELMCHELKHDDSWRKEQVASFTRVAEKYLLKSYNTNVEEPSVELIF